MLTWTLIGRSHIGFHQMLKTIERMSRGGGEAGQRRARLTRGGGGLTGQMTKVTKKDWADSAVTT